jgi:hypothetical protein
LSKGIDITLFEPTGRDMKLDYPELGNITEFHDLSFREMRLCWMIGNRTSPIANYSTMKRVRAACEQVYKKQSRNKEWVVDMMENGTIPEKLKKGISRMASFRPSVRLRAKLMDEYMFDQLNGLIHVSEEDKRAMDTDEKKKYADLLIKVSSELPSLVTRMESGYGINVSDENEDVDVKANITDVRDRI